MALRVNTLFRSLNVEDVNDLLELRVTPQSPDFCTDLGFKVIHHAESVVERLRVITQIRYCVILERGGCRSFL